MTLLPQDDPTVAYQTPASSIIDTQKLKQQSERFIDLLRNDLFFEAHEALEELWFPLRFHKKDADIILLRACINAAVSFELLKRGRQDAALKPWANFTRNKTVMVSVIEEHKKVYNSIYKAICVTHKRLESSHA